MGLECHDSSWDTTFTHSNKLWHAASYSLIKNELVAQQITLNTVDNSVGKSNPQLTNI